MKQLFYFLVLVSISRMAQSQDLVIDLYAPPEINTEKGYKGQSALVRTIDINRPQLLVYLPKERAQPSPVIIICPGGGYNYLSLTHEGIKPALWLQSIGLTGVVLKYRLPDGTFDNQNRYRSLQDAHRALEVLREQADKLNLDVNRIGIMGFSAGGHLAANTSVHAPDSIRPAFTVLIYPVISLEPGTTHKDTRNNTLGNRTELEDYFSADQQVSELTPPAFLVHGIDDRVVPVANALQYQEALRNFSVPVETHLFQKARHGFGMAENEPRLSHWTALLKGWLMINQWL